MMSQLTLIPLLERAGKVFPNAGIVSQRPDNSTRHRCTYSDFYRRARALAAGLQDLGLRPGDRVASLMWNHSMHLEAYFGVPVVGGVLHTLNLRLHPDELAYIVNNAGDRFLIVDDVLLPVFEKIRKARERSIVVIVAPFSGKPLPWGYDDYEVVLQREADATRICGPERMGCRAACATRRGRLASPKASSIPIAQWRCTRCRFPSRTTSRSTRHDTILPAMSMFHANAWGLPHAAVMNGSNLVLPGPNLQPDRLLDALSSNHVTLTGGVPTIWLGVLDALEREPDRWRLENALRIVVAGSAAPETLFRRFDKFGVRVIQPWGMTETTPIATVCTLKPHMAFLVRRSTVRAAGQAGAALAVHRDPRDRGRRRGAVGRSYAGRTGGAGTVGRCRLLRAARGKRPVVRRRMVSDRRRRDIDPEGYVKITDRAKDLIKSGGEWISSVDVENALVAHPAVAEAAVIAVPDPKWQERPLAVVVLKGECTATDQELREFLATRFAKWQLPDHRLRAGTAAHLDGETAEVGTARTVQGLERPASHTRRQAAERPAPTSDRPPGSVAAQCLNRVAARSARGRHVARDDRNGQEDGGRTGETERVPRADFIEQPFEHARDEQRPRPAPMMPPIAASRAPWPTTRRTMSRRSAPRAMRTPNSRWRWLAV